jgi:hypothetical protein
MFRSQCLLSLLLAFSIAIYSPLQAQKKIFQTVKDEISTQVNPIFQDNTLVGYLVFSQLEEAKADSFNYKLTILDENLNDIGIVKFREEKLYLKAVSFEQDVLCIAYLKSNIIYREFKTIREFKKALPNASSSLFMQFLSLQGNIVNTKTIPLEFKPEKEPAYAYGYYVAQARLKHDVELKNIPQTGFGLLYGDDSKNNLLVYNTTGVQTWQKTIPGKYLSLSLYTSGPDMFILSKKKDKMNDGGYELLGYSSRDTTTYSTYALKDKHGNSLKPFSFDKDPVSGNMFIAGEIINPVKGNNYWSGVDLTKGPNKGFFTIDIEDFRNRKFNEKLTYYADGSKSFLSKRGYHRDSKSYVRYRGAFRDYQGNTIYIGTGIARKPKWGAIITGVITMPIIIPPLFILALGATDGFKATDAVLIKLDKKGQLTFDNTVPANHTRLYHKNAHHLGNYDKKTYYLLRNDEAKTNFVVIDDAKDIIFYNATKRQVVRTVPHKDGKLRTAIYPAKEGHVMITEYNKKENYLSVSIEAL